MKFDNIYINHLSHRIDRKQSVIYQFDILGLNFEFFYAIRDIDGSVGNKLSFIKILEKSLSKNEKNILFCEDDVLFRKCFITDIDDILFNIHQKDFDILCFHHPQPFDATVISDITHKRQKPWCSHCLYLNNLNKIYEYVKSKEFNKCGLDFVLVNSSLNCYITKNEYVLQLDDYSDINQKVVSRFKHKNIYGDLIWEKTKLN